jgi:hypothetical protein
MIDDDLTEIDARIARSKKDFVEALDSYGEYDGQKIIDEFLTKFLTPEQKRSELAREFAREAIAQIRGFDRERTSITFDVGIGLGKMNSTVSAIAIALMGETIENMGKSHQTDGQSALENVVADVKGFDEAQATFVVSGKTAKQNAYKVGIHINRVQETAAGLLRMRILTLRAFKKENLGTSPAELIHQVRQGLYKETATVVLDKAWEGVQKSTEEIVKFIAEEDPSVRVLKLIVNIVKAFKGEPPDTSPGGTDLLLGLVGQMRKEAAVLQALRDTYAVAMADLDRIAAAPLKEQPI